VIEGIASDTSKGLAGVWSWALKPRISDAALVGFFVVLRVVVRVAIMRFPWMDLSF
jgi:hypothetical protein